MKLVAITAGDKKSVPVKMLEPTNAKYLLDYLYFTRDDEQFRYYKKVSKEIYIYVVTL